MSEVESVISDVIDDWQGGFDGDSASIQYNAYQDDDEDYENTNNNSTEDVSGEYGSDYSYSFEDDNVSRGSSGNLFKSEGGAPSPGRRGTASPARGSRSPGGRTGSVLSTLNCAPDIHPTGATDASLSPNFCETRENTRINRRAASPAVAPGPSALKKPSLTSSSSSSFSSLEVLSSSYSTSPSSSPVRQQQYDFIQQQQQREEETLRSAIQQTQLLPTMGLKQLQAKIALDKLGHEVVQARQQQRDMLEHHKMEYADKKQRAQERRDAYEHERQDLRADLEYAREQLLDKTSRLETAEAALATLRFHLEEAQVRTRTADATVAELRQQVRTLSFFSFLPFLLAFFLSFFLSFTVSCCYSGLSPSLFPIISLRSLFNLKIYSPPSGLLFFFFFPFLFSPLLPILPHFLTSPLPTVVLMPPPPPPPPSPQLRQERREVDEASEATKKASAAHRSAELKWAQERRGLEDEAQKASAKIEVLTGLAEEAEHRAAAERVRLPEYHQRILDDQLRRLRQQEEDCAAQMRVSREDEQRRSVVLDDLRRQNAEETAQIRNKVRFSAFATPRGAHHFTPVHSTPSTKNATHLSFFSQQPSWKPRSPASELW
jgi:hypothetical protein